MGSSEESPGRKERLVIVGNSDEIHVGAHLLRAARSLGLKATFCDTKAAFGGPWPVRKLNWHLRGRRPPGMGPFGESVVAACRIERPSWLVATGLAPLSGNVLERIRGMGILTINYLTDDPWNPAHRAGWFFDTLPHYDCIFSTRRANLEDLVHAGCRKVKYLPFAYDPQIHFPECLETDTERDRFDADILFFGGADCDRVSWILALIHAGFKVVLYGGYWERYHETRRLTRGHADVATLREAVAGAKVALCLVRRANRDGHAMRSFEIPAMGGCMLTEDTEEHREIFGPEGNAVVYFRTVDEMVNKARWLIDHPDERKRLAAAAHRLIVTGPNTYKDRLATMLKLARSNV
jgi:spore maturation protein CgeB